MPVPVLVFTQAVLRPSRAKAPVVTFQTRTRSQSLPAKPVAKAIR